MITARNVRIAIIPGDGVGPDVINATISVLDAVQDCFKGLNLSYIFAEAGLNCIPKYGTNLPDETKRILKETDCCLKGPLTTPEEPGSPKSVAVQIRTMFDLFANMRPIKNLPNIESLSPNIDMVIVRENTEGLYSGVEFLIGDNSAVAIRIITEKCCLRIAKFAFDLTIKRKRHVTYVHKANILKLTDGIFKNSVIKVSDKFKDVTVDDMHIDAAAMRLIKMPTFFDVIVTTNLFGDILSDEAAQLVGGLGVVPGANIGEKYAMFEPIHGSAPKYAGKDRVNPIATILSAKLMLDWLGFDKAGLKVEEAIKEVLIDGKSLTYDIAPPGIEPVKCSELGKKIADKIIEIS